MFRLGAEAGLREVHPVQTVEILLLDAQRQATVRWRSRSRLAPEAVRRILRESDLHEITLH